MFELERPAKITDTEWLEMQDFRQDLLVLGDELDIYTSGHIYASSSFVAALLLPRKLLSEQALKELLDWQFNPVNSQWGYWESWAEDGTKLYELSSPYSSERPAIIESAVPLLTLRYNNCRSDQPGYYEANQQITHVHDLHWLEEHDAYCTLDEQGDIHEVIKIRRLDNQIKITCQIEVILKHLILGDFVLIRFFDVDRWIGSVMPYPDADSYASVIHWEKNGIRARWTPVGGKPSLPTRAFLRGYQLIYSPSDPTVRHRIMEGKPKQYCSFITFDWKHKRVADVSCDPEQLGNYFVESDYPFEISPVFFKRAVLLKYQSDPDKYEIEDRRVICRGAWDLRIGLNDAEQVQVYLKDLGQLPYQEQLYWKSFNEDPKDGVSESIFRTDFLGEWYQDQDPLRGLKELLDEFAKATHSGNKVDIWHKPFGSDTNLPSQIHYLATESPIEWETSIARLDKFVVEGFDKSKLKAIAEQEKIPNAKDLGSLKLLREVLLARGVDSHLVSIVIEPLFELNTLRSHTGSHRKGTEADQMIKAIRKTHKSFSTHFRDLVTRIFASLSALSEMISSGSLDLT
jgi:hypothetical protein